MASPSDGSGAPRDCGCRIVREWSTDGRERFEAEWIVYCALHGAAEDLAAHLQVVLDELREIKGAADRARSADAASALLKEIGR